MRTPLVCLPSLLRRSSFGYEGREVQYRHGGIFQQSLDANMVNLDDAENAAVNEFLTILDEQRFEPKPLLLSKRIHRTVEGQIVVPVSVKGMAPSLSLAILMEHKSEQLYKHTACRVVLAQCPVEDPEKAMYVWGGRDWQAIP